MKTLIALIFCLFITQVTSLAKEMPIKLIINGQKITGAKYYIIFKGKGYLLKYSDDKMIIPDTLNNTCSILFVYKNFHAFISSYYDTKYLEIYFDNRVKHNLIQEKSRFKSLKLKYPFKKRYLILYGNGMETLTFQSKNNYRGKYGITP